MQTTKKVSVPATMHPSDYVNHQTGETMDSEMKDGLTVKMREDTGHFVIDSNEYVVFDAGAIEYLQSAAKADVSRVIQMGNMVKGDCAVIYQNNNHPHDSSTLPGVLNLSQDKFYKMVRRLVSLNVLSYCVCAPAGYTQKLYMLNPYIARKRKTFDSILHEFFRDITKPIDIDSAPKIKAQIKRKSIKLSQGLNEQTGEVNTNS